MNRNDQMMNAASNGRVIVILCWATAAFGPMTSDTLASVIQILAITALVSAWFADLFDLQERQNLAASAGIACVLSTSASVAGVLLAFIWG